MGKMRGLRVWSCVLFLFVVVCLLLLLLLLLLLGARVGGVGGCFVFICLFCLLVVAVFAFYTTTWTAGSRLLRIYLHFWSMGAIMQGAYHG